MNICTLCLAFPQIWGKNRGSKGRKFGIGKVWALSQISQSDNKGYDDSGGVGGGHTLLFSRVAAPSSKGLAMQSWTHVPRDLAWTQARDFLWGGNLLSQQYDRRIFPV